MHNTAQNSSDNVHSYPPVIRAEMMSTGGEGMNLCQLLQRFSSRTNAGRKPRSNQLTRLTKKWSLKWWWKF